MDWKVSLGSDLQVSVQNLESSVSGLLEWRMDMDGARFVAAHSSQSSPSSSSTQPQSNDTRVFIREELIELRERDKRRDTSWVFNLWMRLTQFDQLTMTLLKKNMQLNDLTQLNTQFIRARIFNKDDRISLLSSSNKLKNLRQYSSVYISRDLTYRQRQEIRNRRLTSQQQQLVSVATGANSVHYHIKHYPPLFSFWSVLISLFWHSNINLQLIFILFYQYFSTNHCIQYPYFPLSPRYNCLVFVFYWHIIDNLKYPLD